MSWTAGWKRPAVVALALAELHLDRALTLRSAGGAAAAAAPKAAAPKAPRAASASEAGRVRDGAAPSNGNSSGGGGGAAAIERHLTASEANLGLFQLAGFQEADEAAAEAVPDSGDSAQPPADIEMAEADAPAADGTLEAEVCEAAGLPPRLQVLVRQQWLLGRIAEARRQPSAAATAFAACRRLLLGALGCQQSQQASPDQSMPDADAAAATIDGSAPPVTGAASSCAAPEGAPAQLAEGVAEAAAAAAAAPEVRLRGCAHDAVISAAALDAKLQALRLFDVLGVGPERLKQGRHAEVVQVSSWESKYSNATRERPRFTHVSAAMQQCSAVHLLVTGNRPKQQGISRRKVADF